MANPIDSLTDEEAIAWSAKLKGGVDKLSDEDAVALSSLLSSKNKPTEPRPGILEGSKTTVGRAARLGIESGATLGASPLVAGLGAAAGTAYSKLAEEGKGIGESVEASKRAFLEARAERTKEERKAEEDRPLVSGASQLGGSLLAGGPLTKLIGGATTSRAARGAGRVVEALQKSTKAGLVSGAGEAAGRAETLEEAAEMLATGGVSGALAGPASALTREGGKIASKGARVSLLASANLIEKGKGNKGLIAAMMEPKLGVPLIIANAVNAPDKLRQAAANTRKLANRMGRIDRKIIRSSLASVMGKENVTGRLVDQVKEKINNSIPEEK